MTCPHCVSSPCIKLFIFYLNSILGKDNYLFCDFMKTSFLRKNLRLYNYFVIFLSKITWFYYKINKHDKHHLKSDYKKCQIKINKIAENIFALIKHNVLLIKRQVQGTHNQVISLKRNLPKLHDDQRQACDYSSILRKYFYKSSCS